MKNVIRVFMGILLTLLVYSIITYTPNIQKLEIDTLMFNNYAVYEVPVIVETPKVEVKVPTPKKNTQEIAKKETTVVPSQNDVTVELPAKETIKETTKEKSEEPASSGYDILETFTGKMSGYGPDCRGCSGNTASGYNIENGIYYSDTTYGSVRIVAGDKKYPFGTIVRVIGPDETFYAIVLDRGGAIGIGKSFQFDLLFTSESDANVWGIKKNITFEIVRSGY